MAERPQNEKPLEPNEDSDKLDHEAAKLQLEIKKLRSETGIAGVFASRVWPIFASAITIFLSIYAFHIASKTQNEQMRLEAGRAHKQYLAQAIDLASDSSKGSSRLIAGIWELDKQWSDPEDHETIASVLAANLSLSDEYRFARCAAAEVIGDAMAKAPEENRAELAKLLYGTKSGEIGLVVRQHLLLLVGKKDLEASNSCKTALDATREAIRKNWRYLRNINLNQTDLSNIQLYEADLGNSSFRSTNLTEANFRCANLYRADLEGNYWTGPDPDFHFANVKEAQPEKFRQFAKLHGAVEMEEQEWGAWRNAGFSVDEDGKRVLNGSSGSECGKERLPQIVLR